MNEIAFNPLFGSDLESMTTEARVEMCSQAMAKFAETGIVAVTDALVMPICLSIYQDTLSAGKAKVRVYTMPAAFFLTSWNVRLPRISVYPANQSFFLFG